MCLSGNYVIGWSAPRIFLGRSAIGPMNIPAEVWRRVPAGAGAWHTMRHCGKGKELEKILVNAFESLSHAVTRTCGYQVLRPKYLVFESTSQCQFRCEICGAAAAHRSRLRGLMDWDLFQHLVEQAVRLRPERVYLHAFGEPLLHPRIVDMVEALSRRGLATELVTNGDLLTPQLARQLRSAGLFELGISHPNISPLNYQTCRGCPPSADLDARISEAVAEWEGHSRRVSIRCLTIRKLLGKGSEETAVFLNRWLNTPGVDLVVFHGYLPWPKHVCPDLVDFLLAKPRRCQVGMRSLSVLWDGVITPCSYDAEAQIKLGRAPQDSLAEIYNGSALRQLRRQWMARRGLPELCQRCLVPRCPTPAAWIGRQEWKERMAMDRDQKLVWLGATSKLTLARNKDLPGDRE
jgi:radical SAM protein with 4Fe4S-binding SPASM domain